MKRIVGIAIGIMVTIGALQAQTKLGNQLNLKEIKKLSVAEMLNKAKLLAKDNNSMYSSVLSALAKARKANDSAKGNCLRNITPAMKGLVRIGQQSLLNLKELAATGDRMDAESQFVKVVISNRKMMEMYDMANQCGTANVRQVFEKGVHVEKEVLPGMGGAQDVADGATSLTYQLDPFDSPAITPQDRFVAIDRGSEIPASDFY